MDRLPWWRWVLGGFLVYVVGSGMYSLFEEQTTTERAGLALFLLVPVAAFWFFVIGPFRGPRPPCEWCRKPLRRRASACAACGRQARFAQSF